MGLSCSLLDNCGPWCFGGLTICWYSTNCCCIKSLLIIYNNVDELSIVFFFQAKIKCVFYVLSLIVKINITAYGNFAHSFLSKPTTVWFNFVTYKENLSVFWAYSVFLLMWSDLLLKKVWNLVVSSSGFIKTLFNKQYTLNKSSSVHHRLLY